MLHLVTGHKGVAHIKSENIKHFNRDATAYSSFTSGTFTISLGEDSSKLKIGSGFGYIEGRMFEIERGTTEEVSFDLANSGFHRIDKVVARYFEEDGIEGVYLNVVRGVEVLESVEIEPSEQTQEECVIFYAEITSSRADLYSYGRVSIVEENATCTSEKSFSHSEGDSTNALGECSHSEGSNSTANGYAAHAGGFYCSARGDQSFAHGENSLARGDNSVAIGRELIADAGQTVFGRFNKTEDDALFIIGNGEVEEFERSNAFVVTENDAIINGKSFNQLNNDLHSLEYNGWTIPEGMPLKDSSKVERIKFVDLDLDYNGAVFVANNQTFMKAPSSNNEKANIYCNAYTTNSDASVSNGQISLSTNHQIVIVDSRFNTISALKTANSSVYLYYELNTPKTLSEGQEAVTKLNASLYVQNGTLNDFNSYAYNGKFLFNNSSVISNAPSVPSTQGILEVVKSDAMIKQMFFHSNGTVFSRVSWFGSWRSWKQIDN